MKINKRTLRKLILEAIKLPDPSGFPRLKDEDEFYDDESDYTGVQDMYADPEPARIYLGKPEESDVDEFRKFLESALRKFNNPVNIAKRKIPNTIAYVSGTEHSDAAGNTASISGGGMAKQGSVHVNVNYIPPGRKAYYGNNQGYSEMLTVPELKSLIMKLKAMTPQEKEAFLNDGLYGMGPRF